MTCPWAFQIQVFRMSLAGPGIAFSAHTPQTLGQVPVQEAGEERRAHREPLLVHLRRPRLQLTLARMLCLFGESRERGEDRRAVFLSFLFPF